MSRFLLYGTIPLFVSLISFLTAFVAQLVIWSQGLMKIPAHALLAAFMGNTIFVCFLFFAVFLAMTAVSFIGSMFHPKPEKIRYDPIKNPKISVVMTAWNDQEAIYEAVKDLRRQKNVVEVVVVENNSTDETAKLARKAGARVVTETIPGYGSVCKRSLKEASPKANIVVLVEGDMTFNGYDVEKLVPYLDNVDMVLGTRTTHELMNKKTQLGWFMTWGNLFLAKLIQIKYWNFKMWGGVRLTDVGCTLRAIRKESLDKVVDKLKILSDHFSPHMIIVALNNNLKVIEIPVTFKQRVGVSKGAGGSNWKAFKVGLKMLWTIFFT